MKRAFGPSETLLNTYLMEGESGAGARGDVPSARTGTLDIDKSGMMSHDILILFQVCRLKMCGLCVPRIVSSRLDAVLCSGVFPSFPPAGFVNNLNRL
jgi:hypothetical protein